MTPGRLKIDVKLPQKSRSRGASQTGSEKFRENSGCPQKSIKKPERANRTTNECKTASNGQGSDITKGAWLKGQEREPKKTKRMIEQQ